MIKESIYRSGGSLTWGSTIGDAKKLFKAAKEVPIRIQITAGDKGFGKSTAFECLAARIPGISVEGDIMSVLAYTLVYALKTPVPNLESMKFDEVANGTAIPGFIPWSLEVVNKDKMFKGVLASFLGQGFSKKIGCSTAFHGQDATLRVVIVPDYGFYRKMMERRTSAMIADASKTKEWRDHIKKHHKVLSWVEFSEAVAARRGDLYFPNFGAKQFQHVLDDFTTYLFKNSKKYEENYCHQH